MFKSVVEMVTLLIKEIIFKEINENRYKVFQALFCQLNDLQMTMKDVIDVLSEDETNFKKTLWETPKELWISKINTSLINYECSQEMIFWALEEYDNLIINGQSIFTIIPKLLRDRIDDPAMDYLHVNSELVIQGYSFRYMDTVVPKADDKNYREFYSTISFDIKSAAKKLEVLENAKEDVAKIEKLLMEFKTWIQEKYGIVELAVEPEKTLIQDWE